MKLPLSQPEQRYCLLFQQSLAAIYTTTADGRLLDCNEAMVDMLGYESRADLMSLRRPSCTSRRPTDATFFAAFARVENS